MHRLHRALLVLLLAGSPAAAQDSAVTYRASWRDAVSVGVAGGLYLLPSAIGLPSGPPSCAPCDRATLSGIERFAAHPINAASGRGSNVLLAGVLGLTTFATVQGSTGDQWRGNAAVVTNAVAWTAASTEWLKVTIRRERPVLYTPDAAAAAGNPGNQESFPSGHASVAFAAATSYLVLARREHLRHRTRNALLLYGGAAAVSALRVAAGKHFPTDVVAGAALGSGIGWLVATIHR